MRQRHLQRKDGLFSARYYAKDGKRKEKYFETLPEAKTGLLTQDMRNGTNLIVTSPRYDGRQVVLLTGLKISFVTLLRIP